MRRGSPLVMTGALALSLTAVSGGHSASGVASKESPHVRHDVTLADLDGTAPDDLWAVGTRADKGFFDPTPLTMHYDGSSWRKVPSYSGEGYLNAVAAVSANDVWAAGEYVTEGGSGLQILILHWNGIRWRTVSTPLEPGERNQVSAISVLAPDDIVVSGSYWVGERYRYRITLHWDGSTWSDTGAPLSQYVAFDALSRNEAWGVGAVDMGSQGRLPQSQLISRWDGQTWRHVKAPNPPLSESLFTVTAIASDDVWALGYTEGLLRRYGNPLVEHWDGRHWQIVDDGLGFDRFDSISDIDGTSRTDAWLTGAMESSGIGILQHWDGLAWTAVENPAGRLSGARLEAVRAFAPDDAWAVGTWHWCGGRYCYDQRILEHWDGTTWTMYHRP